MQIRTEADKLETAARNLVLKGWSVIPTQGKRPLGENGFKDAVRTLEAVRELDFSGGGLAVVPDECVVVLDIDPPKGGNEEAARALAESAYNRLMREWKVLTESWIERTPSGGYHIFTRLPLKVKGEGLKKRIELPSGLAFELLGNGKGAIVVSPTAGYEVIYDPKAPQDLPELPLRFWEQLGFLGEKQKHKPSEASDRTEAIREACISRLYEMVSEAVPGNRNNTVNRAFFILGRAVQGLDEAKARAHYEKLLAYFKERVVAEDFRESELAYHARRAFEQGLQALGLSFLTGVEQEAFRLTHAGVAEYFTALRGEDFVYLEPLGWLHWNGRYWQRIPTGRGLHNFILSEVKDFLGRLAVAGKDPEYVAKAKRFIEQSSHLDGAVSMVKRVFGKYLVLEELPGPEASAHLLPVANGVINLKTGELEPFEAHKDKYFTSLIEIPYRKEAEAPAWISAMRVWAVNDAEWLNYMHKLLGSFLTGDTSAQQVYFFWGEAANGKSTLIETVASILGGFARRATSDLIKRRKSDEHPTKIAELVGKRLAYISDFTADAALDDETIKTHSGEDTLTGRFMRQDYFNFKPTHKLVLLTNHLPRIQADPALYRRVVVVPFKVTFMNSRRRDPYLRQKLIAEREGILAWLVEGAKRHLENPIEPLPEFLENARALYFRKDNPVALFFETMVEKAGGEKVSRKQLYLAYVGFCDKLSTKPLKQPSFTRQVELLYPSLKEALTFSEGERMYKDYKLKTGGDTDPTERILDMELDTIEADKLDDKLFAVPIQQSLFTPNQPPIPDHIDAKGVVFIQTPTQLDRVIEAVKGRDVGFDLETTALYPAKGEARILSLSTGEVTYVIDLFAVPEAWEVLKYPAKLVGHNLVFDWSFVLANENIEAQLFDTAIAYRVIKGTNEYVSLAKLAEGVGEVLDKALQKADWGGKLTEEMIRYAAKDAEVVLKIAGAQAEQLQQRGLVETFEREMRALPCVALMRAKGVGINTQRVDELEKSYKAKLAEIEEKLKPYGAGLMGVGTNWNSPEQVLEALRRQGIDVGDTRYETLATQRSHPLVSLVLEYREVVKQLGFLKEYKSFVHNGRIYADWNPLGAASGRMTCAKPNLQQAPQGEFRRIFWPGEGRVLVKADYSQIELRVAAAWAEEKRMIEAFRAGKDLHKLTAALILNKPEDQVTKEDRTLAKAVNFGLLYGMGAEALRVYALTNYGVQMTEQKAKQVRYNFFKAYPALANWHKENQNKLTIEKEFIVRTLGGRQRKVYKLTEALNTPIQGSAADGLKEALALLYEELRRRGWLDKVFPVLVVHDEVVLEAPEDLAYEAMKVLVDVMREGMERIVRGVPIEVEAAVYLDWGVTPELPF